MSTSRLGCSAFGSEHTPREIQFDKGATHSGPVKGMLMGGVGLTDYEN